jgi:hypothetical protein
VGNSLYTRHDGGATKNSKEIQLGFGLGQKLVNCCQHNVKKCKVEQRSNGSLFLFQLVSNTTPAVHTCDS